MISTTDSSIAKYENTLDEAGILPTDFHVRFPDSYHLCSYAGLIPSTHSSGGITYHGSITKRGSKYLRWIMLECVHAHIRNEIQT
jgi:transposase